ncbi:MAG: chorismate mutase [Spirochaetaceae bacterium]|jgi:chorismate mutase|nr:chorismate mutase [Spirochaetaceae bacterium]
MKKLAALRGATQVENDAGSILKEVAALYDEMLRANGLAESDLVSLVFSVTGDITAKNPCAALRESGRACGLALFTTLEPPFPPNHPRIIRALLHCYTGETAAPKHVYRNGAQILRPDISL